MPRKQPQKLRGASLPPESGPQAPALSSGPVAPALPPSKSTPRLCPGVGEDDSRPPRVTQPWTPAGEKWAALAYPQPGTLENVGSGQASWPAQCRPQQEAASVGPEATPGLSSPPILFFFHLFLLVGHRCKSLLPFLMYECPQVAASLGIVSLACTSNTQLL